jgi:hypothetical protein
MYDTRQTVPFASSVNSSEPSLAWAMPTHPRLAVVDDEAGDKIFVFSGGDAIFDNGPNDLIAAERKFWRCVESGEPPRLFGVESPKPRIEAGPHCGYEHLEFLGRWRRRRKSPL